MARFRRNLISSFQRSANRILPIRRNKLADRNARLHHFQSTEERRSRRLCVSRFMYRDYVYRAYDTRCKNKRLVNEVDGDYRAEAKRTRNCVVSNGCSRSEYFERQIFPTIRADDNDYVYIVLARDCLGKNHLGPGAGLANRDAFFPARISNMNWISKIIVIIANCARQPGKRDFSSGSRFVIAI